MPDEFYGKEALDFSEHMKSLGVEDLPEPICHFCSERGFKNTTGYIVDELTPAVKLLLFLTPLPFKIIKDKTVILVITSCQEHFGFYDSINGMDFGSSKNQKDLTDYRTGWNRGKLVYDKKQSLEDRRNNPVKERKASLENMGL